MNKIRQYEKLKIRIFAGVQKNYLSEFILFCILHTLESFFCIFYTDFRTVRNWKPFCCIFFTDQRLYWIELKLLNWRFPDEFLNLFDTGAISDFLFECKQISIIKYPWIAELSHFHNNFIDFVQNKFILDA